MSSINQKRLLWAIASFIVVAACVLVFNNTRNVTADTITVETYKVDQGWGYLVRKGKKKIIDQPYMPCVIGNKPFPDEKSAKNIGELVALKVTKNELPTINADELQNIMRSGVK